VPMNMVLGGIAAFEASGRSESPVGSR